MSHFTFPKNYQLLFGVVTKSVYKGKCLRLEYEDSIQYNENTYKPKQESIVDYDSSTFVDTDKTERLERYIPQEYGKLNLTIEGDMLYQDIRNNNPSSSYKISVNGKLWKSFSTEKFVEDLKKNQTVFVGNYTKPFTVQESLPRAKRSLRKQVIGADDGNTKLVKSDVPGSRVCVLLHNNSVVSWWKTSIPFYYFFNILFNAQRNQQKDVTYFSLQCSSKLGIKSPQNYEKNEAKLEESSMYKRHCYIEACVNEFLLVMGNFLKSLDLYQDEFMLTLSNKCKNVKGITELNGIINNYKIIDVTLSVSDVKMQILNKTTDWATITELEEKNFSSYKDLLHAASYTLDDFFKLDYVGEPMRFKECKILFQAKDSINYNLFFYTDALVEMNYIRPRHYYLGQKLM